jgi:hypothetical protein
LRGHLTALFLGAIVVHSPEARAQSSQSRLEPLVGGTLIDGTGGPLIRNSVIIIDGDRIRTVGQVGRTAIPAGAELISTEGMSVLPGLWDMPGGGSDDRHPGGDLLARGLDARRSCYQSARADGSMSEKVAPAPGALSSVRSPRMPRARWRLIASPRPVPLA